MKIFLRAFIVICFFVTALANAETGPTSTLTNTTNTTTTFSSEQEAQIQKIVHDYLLKNPKLLVEMLKNLQEQKTHAGVTDNAKIIFFNPTSPVAGNANGNVTVVAFHDYQCPHCKTTDPAINELVNNNNNIRVIYKELPIFGDTSEYAARAALAAQLQGKYAEFHAALMQAKAPFTQEQIIAIARSVGLNINKLESDMNKQDFADEIKNNRQLAMALGFQGTPAFIIATTPSSQNPIPHKFLSIPGGANVATLQETVAKIQK